MITLTSRLRKSAAGALAAVTLAGALAASTASADARPWEHRGIGPGIAAGILGGLALGALAARPYSYGGPAYYAGNAYGRCWIEPRRVTDRFGRVFVRRVEVCG